MSEYFFEHTLEPRTSYAHTYGHVTNGRGVGIRLHGSTRSEEIIALVALLDLLSDATAGAVDIPAWRARMADYRRRMGVRR